MSKLVLLVLLFFAACSDAAPPTANDEDAGTPRDAGGHADAAELWPDAASPLPDANTVSAELEPFILEKMREAGAPGLAAAIIKNGAIAWTAGFGEANIEEQRPVTPDSIFVLASISKTPIAIAAMQLVEQNLIALDDDLSDHLPFPVRNPNYPDQKITLHMLLTHTSSLLDSAEIDQHTVPGDSPISLREFMEGYVTVGGDYYRRENWSSSVAPGAAYEYSNSGASLAAYVVEAVTNEDYDLYTKRTIFHPLGLSHTSYKLAGLDQASLAMPYGGDATSGYTAYGHYGYPDYPDGNLRTSVRELARYLIMFMQGGELDSTRILQASSVEEITRAQISAIDPSQGLIWYYIQYSGRRMLGHNGAYLGTSTDMYFDPSDGVGFIVLTNGDTYLLGSNAQVQALDEIERRILEEAERL